MNRIAILVEYDGSRFRGWQTQSGQRTVQHTLERALSVVADAPVDLVCAGRTDAGVHANFQVAHFDTNAVRSARSWVLGANSNLDADVAVVWANTVSPAFHARFSAESRSYCYLISVRQARSALWHGKLTWICRELDPKLMQQGADHLVGEHDFSAFRAAGCQARSPVRTIESLTVDDEDGLILLRVRANAFLQHMVRNIAGVLIEIGCGERPPEWAQEVLVSKQREAGGVTAPPDGLYLTGVTYPPEFMLPRPEHGSIKLPMFRGPGFHDSPDCGDQQ